MIIIEALGSACVQHVDMHVLILLFFCFECLIDGKIKINHQPFLKAGVGWKIIPSQRCSRAKTRKEASDINNIAIIDLL